MRIPRWWIQSANHDWSRWGPQVEMVFSYFPCLKGIPPFLSQTNTYLELSRSGECHWSYHVATKPFGFEDRVSKSVNHQFPSLKYHLGVRTYIYIYLSLSLYLSISGWWFGSLFIFHNIWDNPSHWLIIFKMVKTTNQYIPISDRSILRLDDRPQMATISPSMLRNPCASRPLQMCRAARLRRDRCCQLVTSPTQE